MRHKLIISLLVLSWLTLPLKADLYVLDIGGERVVQDTSSGLSWFPLLQNYTLMTFAEQEEQIEELDYAGTDNWYMASLSDVAELDSNDDTLIWESFVAAGMLAPDSYYYTRTSAPAVSGAHVMSAFWRFVPASGYLSPDGGWAMDWVERDDITAWALTSDISVVPTPTAIILGALGLGTAGMKLRRRRSA